MLLTLAWAEDPTATPPRMAPPAAPVAADPRGPPTSTTVLVWQGFRHYWEREAAFGFHLPHRVSRFESRVHDERHERVDGALRTSARYTFAQSTGVDGDHMRPEGHLARVSSPDLHVHTGTLRVSAADALAPGPVPKAFQRFDEVVRVQLPHTPGPYTVTPVLQGLAFRSACLDGPDDCNSDGIWPYRFRVELAPCEVAADAILCPATLEVGRAWTPGRGGVRPFAVKPLNRRMELEVEVSWAVLVGPADALLAQRFLFENALPSTDAIHLAPQTATLPGLPPGLTAATVGLTSLGFEFVPTGRSASLQQRGRYIGGWNARVGTGALRADAGELDIVHEGGIWLPRTVRNTGVSLEVGMVVLGLTHPEAEVREGIEARGELCSDSDGAPAFSRWRKCRTLIGEPTRSAQTVDLSF